MKSSVAPSTALRMHHAVAAAKVAKGSVTGTVFDIQRFSVHDGPGIRTLVFLKSCPLRCRWCSNPESQRVGPDLLHVVSRCLRCGRCVAACPTGALRLTEPGIEVDDAGCTMCGVCADVCPARAMGIAGREMSVQDVLSQVERDRLFYEHSGGGMTLSGGEPLLQPDFALALLKCARTRGIHTAVETTGCTDPATGMRVLSKTDLILYDIKHLDEATHRAGTGVTNRAILQNAELASQLGISMIVRTPVIPGFNDDPHDILAIGRFALKLGLTQMHLLTYHRYGASKYASLRRTYVLTDLAPPGKEHLDALRVGLESLGLRVRIGG